MILVISSKNSYAAKRLKQESRRKNIECRIMDTAELAEYNFKPKFEFDVLYIRDPYLNGSPKYLPKIIKLAKEAKKQGKKVVDLCISKGELGKGKWNDYEVLKKAGLLIPHTNIASSFFLGKGLPRLSDAFEACNGNSLILKWIYGMGGKNAYLINSQIPIRQSDGKFQKILAQHPLNEWMLQEYIEADFEYKVVCVGYKALPIILKIKFNKKTGRPDFGQACSVPIHRLNGQPINGHATDLINLAETASRVLGRELSKMDILEKDGKFYILEVNRFPGLEGFEKLTRYNVLKDFLTYLIAKK